MKELTKNMAMATAIFFLIMLVWRQDPISAGFSAVIFAMAYAAIRVAMLIFRGDK
jgi:prolipoprotein diacylglyceryltransferase